MGEGHAEQNRAGNGDMRAVVGEEKGTEEDAPSRSGKEQTSIS